MSSIILKTGARYLLPILLLYSVFLLLRGHNLPGGGFVGGLVASIAFVLHSFANGTENTLKLSKHKPIQLIPIGLLLAALSMVLPMFFGLPPMTGVWFDYPLPVMGLIGTSLFFDIGVYLVVIGSILTTLFTISQSTH
ncbi:MAG TPA: Na+/H+ antiporter subunit B [Candidatus Sphingobacterium stercoripullorum]|uniref:Na+/H+ antiporter subunit B n=1 Tax=Candidatus Sphingobacterium stercoripullorum TaxID=2838759 RepID=A0A9D1W6U0_9SPHI|nr:Na+/H+ antiporter subunit B [Candidatus Sphingobacterium stercoripullorum]